MNNILLKLVGSIVAGVGTYIGYEVAKVAVAKAKRIDYKALGEKIKSCGLKDKVEA